MLSACSSLEKSDEALASSWPGTEKIDKKRAAKSERVGGGEEAQMLASTKKTRVGVVKMDYMNARNELGSGS